MIRTLILYLFGLQAVLQSIDFRIKDYLSLKNPSKPFRQPKEIPYLSTMAARTDNDWIELLQQNPEQAIDELFREYYSFICKVIYRVLPNATTTEDLAQEVFFDLWRKKEQLRIKTSIKAYLRKSAINKTLNHIRGQKMQIVGEEQQPEMRSNQAEGLEQLEASELEKQIHQAIDALPERCRQVFLLSRFEELSYREIAEQLGVSVKAIEKQMSKALRLLQATIGPRMPKIIAVLTLIDLFFDLNA